MPLFDDAAKCRNGACGRSLASWSHRGNPTCPYCGTHQTDGSELASAGQAPPMNQRSAAAGGDLGAQLSALPVAGSLQDAAAAVGREQAGAEYLTRWRAQFGLPADALPRGMTARSAASVAGTVASVLDDPTVVCTCRAAAGGAERCECETARAEAATDARRRSLERSLGMVVA